ncbi:hypothetical protein B0I35DRAFT_43384 [Stachybotrys elegans]|uniref:Secreted protein n=1 Tax=Stachybotrys elegans TaxID=80388 RepID=A0A8K0T8X7_9HYPO|nr:hypothetical protein B0I35DRAFT_43384 [Stachybotrys elegans]
MLYCLRPSVMLACVWLVHLSDNLPLHTVRFPPTMKREARTPHRHETAFNFVEKIADKHAILSSPGPLRYHHPHRPQTARSRTPPTPRLRLPANRPTPAPPSSGLRPLLPAPPSSLPVCVCLAPPEKAPRPRQTGMTVR